MVLVQANMRLAHAQVGESKTPKPETRTLSQIATDFLGVGQISPRGLDYREVVIRVEETPLTTHGWVVAAKSGSKQSQVLSWNGWTYPLSSLGPPKSVRADIEAALELDARQLELQKPGFDGVDLQKQDRFSGRNGSYDDATSVSFQTILPFKAVLLEQLGDFELARRIIFALHGYQEKPLFRGQFTEDWLWPGANRVVRAFREGDDATALSALRLMTPAPQKIGLERYSLIRAEMLSQLLADEERRTQPKPPPLDPQSIGFLIQNLEDVGDLRKVPSKQPLLWGEYSLDADETLNKIIARGDEAVEPLLQTLENDTRLTRYIQVDSFHAPWPIYRTTSVADVALSALETILKKNFYNAHVEAIEYAAIVNREREAGAPLVNPNAVLAQRIREEWDKNRVH